MGCTTIAVHTTQQAPPAQHVTIHQPSTSNTYFTTHPAGPSPAESTRGLPGHAVHHTSTSILPPEGSSSACTLRGSSGRKIPARQQVGDVNESTVMMVQYHGKNFLCGTELLLVVW
jgi:hypothetical protein